MPTNPFDKASEEYARQKAQEQAEKDRKTREDLEKYNKGKSDKKGK